jgi:hypothetical protein
VAPEVSPNRSSKDVVVTHPTVVLAPPGAVPRCTQYPVTGEPPSLDGGFQAMWLVPRGLVAVTEVGAVGGLRTTAALGVPVTSFDGGLAPITLEAVTT